MTYKPRSKNPRVDKVRKSWSSAFDDYVADNRKPPRECGFRVRGEDSNGS